MSLILRQARVCAVRASKRSFPRLASAAGNGVVYHLRAAQLSTKAEVPTPVLSDWDEDMRGQVRRGGDNVHFKLTAQDHPLGLSKHDKTSKVWEHPTHHGVWSKEEVEQVRLTHRIPDGYADVVALGLCKAMKWMFDFASGYKVNAPNENMYLNRIIFLETVAGIPGMVGGMVRHLHSLRCMTRDHGWIHTLLEEAENERMHLLTFLALKRPGAFFRGVVLLTQGVFFNLFFLTYLISPKVCHRLVGYLEEEAVTTYTHVIHQIDEGKLPMFERLAPPEVAVDYWKLSPDATFRDLLLVIRADEANHRHVNHTLSDIKQDSYNPFVDQHQAVHFHTAEPKKA